MRNQTEVQSLTKRNLPRLRLFAGRSLNMDDIKEGEDVYFECEIDANPKTHSVKWFHEGQELKQRISEGVIVSNQSLVLQKVKREWAGNYICTAHNSEGAGRSNVVTLSIKFVPACDLSRQQSFGVDQNETIHVACLVNSHPPPRQYRWAFNTSSELLDLSWVKGQTGEELVYTPRSDLDYGSLLCWAENEIGLQEIPCVYHVMKSSLPSPVNDCVARNVSATSAFVMCDPGFDGGAEQFFTLQVLNGSRPDAHRALRVANHPATAAAAAHGVPIGEPSRGAPLPLAKAAPAPRPHFHLTGLRPDTLYVLSVYANNRRGRSNPTTVFISTAADVAERRVGGGSEGFGYLPLAMFSSSLTLLLLVFLVVAVVVRLRHRPHISRGGRSDALHLTLEKRPDEEARVEEDTSSHQKGERTPDVIPSAQNSSEGRDSFTASQEGSRFSLTETDTTKDQFYLVDCYSPVGSQTAEAEKEYWVTSTLPRTRRDTFKRKDFQEVSHKTLANPSLGYKHNDDRLQATFLPEEHSQYSLQSAADLCAYNDKVVLVKPNTRESGNDRTDMGEKSSRRSSTSCLFGLSNSSLVLTNLETFLNENQLESSV